MSVTPKVYRFNPGAKTPAAVIDGVKRVMDAAGTHHWEVVSYTSGTGISLRDKATRSRVLRMAARSSGSGAPTIDCYYSFGGGAESHACIFSGGPSGATYYALANATYGMSSTSAYVVEIEDAIFIVTHKPTGSDGGTGLVDNALGMGVHAGRIGSAHNKSDAALGIMEEGMVCGQLAAYNTSAWSMYHNGIANSQTAVISGSGFGRICIGQTSDLRQWRDFRQAISIPLIENIGDGQSIERLAPFPVAFQTSAGTVSAHSGYTRYIRARKYPYTRSGQVPPDPTPDGIPITNETVLPSAGNPNIGWRHNYSFASDNTVINLVTIWCRPGQEVNV